MIDLSRPNASGPVIQAGRIYSPIYPRIKRPTIRPALYFWIPEGA